MIGERNPDIADMVVRTMEGGAGDPEGGCMAELAAACSQLDRERDHVREQESQGEWKHGWQYWASSVSDAYFRKTTMLLARSAASRAHLRSHSGHNAGATLASQRQRHPNMSLLLPCFGSCSWKGSNFPSRLTRPCVPVMELLDTLGRHRAACSRTGRLRKRATPIERSWLVCAVKQAQG